jgi:hypothetical protein
LETVSAGSAYLSGFKLRAVSGLLRAPLLGPPLRRALAASVLAPALARVRAAASPPPPLFAPVAFAPRDETES